ncbi:MAG: cobalamin-dependent protein [Anaerolineales bacterium]|nr:cobalamin-dependent protein [Anaerolineales bacterium]MCB8989185.1 cobalamin B12-binding domain-containing protein [Ardenticatenaceae bacterium]
MVNTNKTPTFNMKVVVQETGIKPDTLRAWERRYGLPEPDRTQGGHRLYSQYDIDLLKWLLSRQEEGMSISRAAKLWRQMEEEGRDPLLLTDSIAPTETAKTDLNISGDMIAKTREAWLRSCLDYNEPEAQRILVQAFALYPVELVCSEVLQKGLSEIGKGWYEGRVSVQQEHFTSSLAVRQLEVMLSSMTQASRHGRILVACPPNEQHTFGALVLTLLLRRRGWEVIYLGANVPVQRLEESLTTINPHLVVVSAQTLQSASTMLEMANLLQRVGIPLAYGGLVFNQIPALRQHIAGHFLGEDLQKAPHTIEQLFHSPREQHQPKQATAQHLEAIDHFSRHRPEIEAQVQATMRHNDLPPDLLKFTNQELGNNLTAALQLGDVTLLEPNISWVAGLLNNYQYQLPQQLLDQYIQTYRTVIQQHLDPEKGKLILDWFADLH